MVTDFWKYVNIRRMGRIGRMYQKSPAEAGLFLIRIVGWSLSAY